MNAEKTKKQKSNYQINSKFFVIKNQILKWKNNDTL